jgi:hypothetical protein
MKCDLVKELLSGYLDNELSPEDRSRVEKHLADCAACREELAAIKKIDEYVRSADIEEPSRGFTFNLNRQVMDKIRKRSKFSLFKLSPILVPVAVAALVVIILVNIPASGRMIELDDQVMYKKIVTKREVDLKMPGEPVSSTVAKKGAAIKDKAVEEAPAPVAAERAVYAKTAESFDHAAKGGVDVDEVLRTTSLEELEIPDDRVVRAIIDTSGVVVKVATGNTMMPERDTVLENKLKGQQLKPATVEGRKQQIFIDLTRTEETTECTTEP